MPRITTSNAPKATVDELKRVAKKNCRTSAQEALVAVQSYLLSQALPALLNINPVNKRR